MACANASESALAEPERLAHILQELHFGISDHTVSPRDLEQAIQHAFEQAGPVPVLAANPAGIAFIAAHGLAGDIEHAPDIVGILGRSAENAREHHDFPIGDRAIGHGELGTQSDNRSGKSNIIGIGGTLDTLDRGFGRRIRFKRAVAALKQSCPQTHPAFL